MKILSQPSSNTLAALLLGTLFLTGCGSAPVQEGGSSISVPEAQPEALPKMYDRAVTLMQGGDYQAAIPVLQQFIAENPELGGPYLNLGIACRQTGQADAARDALRKAVELNPGNAAAHHQLAILHREAGEFEAALAAYRQALELQPDYALAHRNLGILYDLYLQQPGEALVHYRKYVELSEQQDETVNGWIIDIERRTESAQARISR